VRVAGAFVALAVSPTSSKAVDSPSKVQERDQSLLKVKESLEAARSRLDLLPPLIREAKWDACRTELARAPIVDVGPVTLQLARLMEQQLPDGDDGGVRGLRQDWLSAVRFLDTFCYNNVFVDESRVVLGTKVDFDSPLSYQAEAREALDALIDSASEFLSAD